MKILSQAKEVEIRMDLDNIEESLYHKEASYEQLYWAHGQIKELLFMVYLLQINKKERSETDDSG